MLYAIDKEHENQVNATNAHIERLCVPNDSGLMPAVPLCNKGTQQ